MINFETYFKYQLVFAAIGCVLALVGMWWLGWRDEKRKAMREPSAADSFAAYLNDCDKNCIEPDIAGAFNAGWAAEKKRGP